MKVVVTIPARSVARFEEVLAAIQEHHGREVVVELTLEDEPSVFFPDESRLLVGFNTLRAQFLAPPNRQGRVLHP